MEPIRREPDPPETPENPPQQVSSRCTYCGAPLNSFYYFCASCGRPYRAWHEAVSAPLPPVIDDEERIRRKAPHVPTLFFTYAIGILMTYLLAFVAFREERHDLMLLLGTFVIFIITCVFAVLFWRTLVPQFTRPQRLFHPVALAGYALLPVVLAVNYAFHVLLLGADDMLDPLREAGFSRAGIILLFCVFPAITEEVAFRGLLQHWLTVALKPLRAIVLASALFAAIHFSVVSFPYLLLVGLLLGWVYHRTGSLYPPMLIHFLHNLVVIEFFHISS